MPALVRLAQRSDRAGILELFQRAFSQPPDEREWAWKYDENPCPAASVVALDGERVIGFYGGFGTRYRGVRGNLPGVSAVDVMTDPAARSLGHKTLFTELGKAYCELNLGGGCPFYFGFPHERARIVGERLLGYRSIEPAGLFERALPLPPRKTTLLGRFRRPTFRVVTELGGEHDALAERLHTLPGWRTDRSRATLAWRFFRRPGVSYRFLQLLDARGDAIGYAAVRLVMERALLVDLQLAEVESSALDDLLEAISGDLDGTAARKLEVRAARREPLARRLVQELGFSEAPSDTHFEVRPLDPAFDVDGAAAAFEYRYADHDIF